MQERLSWQIEAALTSGDYATAKSLLQKACDAYYITGQSELTDGEFDTLQLNYIELSGDTDFINNKISKEAVKASRMREAVINFPNMCCWLRKSDSTEATGNFLSNMIKVAIEAKQQIFSMVYTPKYDGFSLSIEYDFKGNPLYAVTRGDGDIGMDYSHFFERDPAHYSAKTINEVMTQYEIKNALKFIVKYEVCITQENLDKVNAIRVSEGDEPFKNRRNAVPALFRKTGGERFREFISLVPIDIDFENNDLLNTMSRVWRRKILEALVYGDSTLTDPAVFDQASWFHVIQNVDPSKPEVAISQLKETYDFFETIRSNSRYMMDGIVAEVNDCPIVEALGGFTESPKHILGWKFDVLVAHTVVTKCVFDYGRSGRRTPVIHFEPVNIYGNTYTKASISNMLRFDEMQLCEGTPIRFSLRGDVLGYIQRDGEDPEGAVPFSVPDDIVEYTYQVTGAGVERRVFAYSVPLIGGELERFFVNTGVRGIKSRTIEILENGMLNNGIKLATIPEFFTAMTEVDFSTFDGFGTKRDAELRAAIKEKNDAGFEAWEILAGLNIQQIGTGIAKSFMTNLPIELKDLTTLIADAQTDEEYASMSYKIHDQLKGKELLGEVRIQRVIDGIYMNQQVILELHELLNIKNTKAAAPVGGESLVFVVTGAMKYFPERDRDLKPLLESLGHKLVNSISGKTNYLVTNTPNSGTKKNQEAQARNVKIITEDELITLLNITPPASKALNVNSQEADDLGSFL